MDEGVKEKLVGTVVFLAFVASVFFVSGWPLLKRPAAGYTVTAGFGQIDGLVEGAEVHLSGIRVGTVERQYLDEDYRAVITMRIDGDIRLPTDTSAAIHTDGLFGTKYVVLDLGGGMEFIPSGGAITYTQDAVVVGDLLEYVIAEGKAKRKERENPSP